MPMSGSTEHPSSSWSFVPFVVNPSGGRSVLPAAPQSQSGPSSEKGSSETHSPRLAKKQPTLFCEWGV